MKAAKPLNQKLFARAMAAGKKDFDAGKIGAPPFWNLLVFRKARLPRSHWRGALPLAGSAPIGCWPPLWPLWLAGPRLAARLCL